MHSFATPNAIRAGRPQLALAGYGLWGLLMAGWIVGATQASESTLGLDKLDTPPAPTVAPVVELSLADPALPVVTNNAPESDLGMAGQPAHGDVDHRLPAESSRLLLATPAASRSEEEARQQYLQTQMNLARQKRREKEFELSRRTLMSLLGGIAPEELKRAALLELALVAQDAGEMLQAQRVFAQYVATYPKHESLPEVLLRQGLLYRRMGATGLANGKFSAVLMALLNLPMEKLEQAQRLALLAKAEMAETHYLTGDFETASVHYGRLLKEDSPHLNRELVMYKMIRCLAALNRNTEAATQAERFVEQFPESEELAEMRFILATAYRQAGRLADAQRQVLVLLESQRDRARKDPAAWSYWQKRAGNEIANQFYQDGDYQVTLTIYSHLAELDPTPAWRAPVLYQVGLVHERLLQNPLAIGAYSKVLDCEKELTPGSLTPSLAATIEMARWRKAALARFERLQPEVASLGVTNLASSATVQDPVK